MLLNAVTSLKLFLPLGLGFLASSFRWCCFTLIAIPAILLWCHKRAIKILWSNCRGWAPRMQDGRRKFKLMGILSTNDFNFYSHNSTNTLLWASCKWMNFVFCTSSFPIQTLTTLGTSSISWPIYQYLSLFLQQKQQ